MEFRKYILAAGAAALISSQAVYAAPVVNGPSMDPLLALSVFGSAQSRAAVCSSGSTAAAGAATATQGVAPRDCVLPVTPPPPPAPVAQAIAPQVTPATKSVQPLLLMAIALGAIVALAVLLEPNDDEEVPVSPA